MSHGIKLDSWFSLACTSLTNDRSQVEIAPRQFSEELLMRPVVHCCQKLHGKLQGKVAIFGKVRSP
ncbi:MULTISPECIES: hypothetical protein [unclassified Microcoleus]|uniref:hypothetical protein n=1 Tax=unclassified Microcoleus TaxID=2642155 RepID=UPI002FD1657F